MTQNSVESTIGLATFEDAAALLEHSIDELDLGAIKVFVTGGPAGRKVVVMNAMDSDCSAVVSL